MDDPPIQPFFFRDPVSSVTHLAMALFGVFVTLLLWRLTGHDRTKRRSLAVFGISVVVLYTASGVYHAINLPKSSAVVDFLRRLDHSAIYALIAGTYTPILAVVLARTWARRLLPLVWGLAIAGIAAKWLFPFAPHPLTVGLYLGLGWIGLLAVIPLTRMVGAGGVAWLALGGLFYTAGSVCEVCSWPILLPFYFGPHEVLHVCDIAGTAAHLVLMVRYVVPFDHESPRAATFRTAITSQGPTVPRAAGSPF